MYSCTHVLRAQFLDVMSHEQIHSNWYIYISEFWKKALFYFLNVIYLKTNWDFFVIFIGFHRFNPPYIEKVPYATLTDSDVEDAVKLTSQPIDMRKDIEELMDQPVNTVGSGNISPSLPVVDKWATLVVCTLTKFLNIIWYFVEYTVWYIFNNIDSLENVLNIVKGYVNVSINTEMKGHTFFITIDIIKTMMSTEGDEKNSERDHSSASYAIPTGPSWKPLKGICCTSFQFTKPRKAQEEQDWAKYRTPLCTERVLVVYEIVCKRNKISVSRPNYPLVFYKIWFCRYLSLYIIIILNYNLNYYKCFNIVS